MADSKSTATVASDPLDELRGASEQWSDANIAAAGDWKGTKFVKPKKPDTGTGSEVPVPRKDKAAKGFAALGWTPEMRQEFTMDVTAAVLGTLKVPKGFNLDDKLRGFIDDISASVDKRLVSIQQDVAFLLDQFGETGVREKDKELETRIMVIEGKIDRIIDLMRKRDSAAAERLEHASEKLGEYQLPDWEQGIHGDVTPDEPSAAGLHDLPPPRASTGARVFTRPGAM